MLKWSELNKCYINEFNKQLLLFILSNYIYSRNNTVTIFYLKISIKINFCRLINRLEYINKFIL